MQVTGKKLNIDVVLESTGIFNDGKKAVAHLNAGAKGYKSFRNWDYGVFQRRYIDRVLLTRNVSCCRTVA